MFHRKQKKPVTTAYDPSKMRPVLRCSICTGEQAAGFLRLADVRFVEVLLIRNDADLQFFREQYGITEDIEKVY